MAVELFGLPEAHNLITQTIGRMNNETHLVSVTASVKKSESMSQLSGRHRIMVATLGTLGMTVLKRVERILDEHDIFHHQLSRSRRSDWRLLVVVLSVEAKPFVNRKSFSTNAKTCTCMIRESEQRRRTSQASSPYPTSTFFRHFNPSILLYHRLFRSRYVPRSHQFSKRIVAPLLDSLIPSPQRCHFDLSIFLLSDSIS